MSKKTLFSLTLVCLVLVGLYFMSSNKSTPAAKGGARALLFSHVDWEAVKAIELEKDNKLLSIKVGEDNGAWVIPDRNDYAASPSSIRSFLLKLMDLSTSQSVEGTEEGIKKLGLSDDSREAGQGSVALKDATGKIIEKLFVGGLRTRKNETPENLMKLSGQYVRIESKPEIYLIPLPLSFQPDASAWLETAIVSVKPSNIYRVRVFEGSQQNEIFQLNRTTSILDDKEPAFTLSISAPEGKEVQDTSIRQLALALEDLRLEDVRKRDSDEVKTFSPNRYVRYELTNGSVYLLGTQDLDGVAYLTLSMSRDESLVAELKELYSREMSESDKEPEIDKKTGDQKNTEGNSNVANDKKAPVAELVYITDEEVKVENDRLSSWVYIVPDFVSKKFVKNTADLFREIPAKSAVEGQ